MKKHTWAFALLTINAVFTWVVVLWLPDGIIDDIRKNGIDVTTSADAGTYEICAQCANCLTSEWRLIPQGHATEGTVFKCDNCGVQNIILEHGINGQCCGNDNPCRAGTDYWKKVGHWHTAVYEPSQRPGRTNDATSSFHVESMTMGASDINAKVSLYLNGDRD